MAEMIIAITKNSQSNDTNGHNDYTIINNGTTNDNTSGNKNNNHHHHNHQGCGRTSGLAALNLNALALAETGLRATGLSIAIQTMAPTSRTVLLLLFVLFVASSCPPASAGGF